MNFLLVIQGVLVVEVAWPVLLCVELEQIVRDVEHVLTGLVSSQLSESPFASFSYHFI